MSVVAPSPAARGVPSRGIAMVDADRAIVIGLTVLAASLRFALIGHQGFWYDEGNTALIVHRSPGTMLTLLRESESTPPLYYAVLWVWARIFGFGEAGLRSLSAVAGVATVPVMYALAVELGTRARAGGPVGVQPRLNGPGASHPAGLIAAALTACNPLLVWYSQEARAYALLVLLSALSLLAFANALREPTARTVGWWVLACALALATHYYAILAVAPQAVWLLRAHRRGRPVQIGLGVLAACGLALLPFALMQKANGRSSWIAAAPLTRRLGQVVPQFLAGFDGPLWGVLEPVAVALAAAGIVLLLTHSDRTARRGGLLAGGLALAGLAFNLVLVAAGTDDLLTRNLLALWPAAAVALAIGLAPPRTWLFGLAAAAGICAIGIAVTIDVDVTRNLQRPDWHVVAQTLGSRPPAHGALSGRAILIQHYRVLLPLSLYQPGLKIMPAGGATVTELDVISFTAPPSAGFCWWGSACNLWQSRMQRRYAIPGFHVAWRRRELQFTIVRLIARRPERITASVVARALRTTRLRADELLFQRA